MSNKHMKNDESNNSTQKKSVSKSTNQSNCKKPKKDHKFLKRFILLILAILIILAGFFTWRVYQNGGGLKGVLTTVVGSDSKKPLSEIRFLLLGESGGLTDSIMICSYNPNTQKANIVSVQRDTFVGKDANNPSASDKINSKYGSKKDPTKTLEAVNKITGLNLEYYIVVDTDALTELVDAIGGVNFEVPIDMNYHDTSKENFITIELKKGMQKIDGNKAEQLLRFRHNDDGTTYPDPYGQDLGRMKTQREFITETLKQTLTPGNILNLGKILDIAANNIKTNLSVSLIKDYIPYAVEFNVEDLYTDVLPGDSVRPDKSGPYIYLLDEAKTQSLISTLFFDGATEETINPDMPKLQILNASGDAKLLEKVINKYKEKGYNILMVGNTSKEVAKSSIINRTKQTTEVADSVKTVLGYGTVTSGKKLNDIDFSITIGKDYK